MNSVIDGSDAKLEIVDGLATITLDRPEALNALSPLMTDELIAHTYRIERDPAIRCVVIRGNGRSFMAGGDVKGMHRSIKEDRDGQLARFEMRVIKAHQIVYQLRRMPKPVVVAVHGAVAGFGLSLMLAADLAIARSDAFFTLAYRHIGLTADGGATYFLPRIVGERKALELAMLGERFDATAALEMGIVNRIAEEANFEEELTNLVQKLATGPTKALGRVKELIRSSLENTWDQQSHREAEGLSFAASTSDHTEGVTAFVEKRRPSFTGS